MIQTELHKRYTAVSGCGNVELSREQIRFVQQVIASACCRGAGHDTGLPRGYKLKSGSVESLRTVLATGGQFFF